jgi:hypothetical protein
VKRLANAALAALLDSLALSAEQLPPGAEERAVLWRDRVDGKRMLLVLDDAKGGETGPPWLAGSARSVFVVIA